jgi:hypothetical protein
MNTSALVLMLASVITVTGFTLYFFFRVLTTPPKPEPDSFSENDAD